jgi:hypothetical protein
MSSNKVFLSLAAVASCIFQVSCGGPVDLRNPTVSELDAADISWGLQPRKVKSGPKRNYQYPIEQGGSAPASTASAAAGNSSGGLPPSPAPQVPPEPALDPATINKLR